MPDREWQERVEQKLDDVIELLTEVLTRFTIGARHMSKEMDALVAQVEKNTSVEKSAVELIQGIAGHLAALIAGRDPDLPTKLQDLTTKLQVQADALAAAIVANTEAPAAPAPAPAPAVPPDVSGQAP